MNIIDTWITMQLSGKDTTMSKHYGKIVSLLATTCIMVNAETIASPDLNVATPAAESIAPQAVESITPQTQDNAQITTKSTSDMEKLVANSEETTEKSAPQKKEKPKKTRTRKAKKSNSKPFWMFWKSEEAYKKELEAKRNGTYVERKKKAKRKKRADVKAESVKAPEENYESLWGPTVLFDADFHMHRNTTMVPYALGGSDTFNVSSFSINQRTSSFLTQQDPMIYHEMLYGFNNSSLIAYSSINNDKPFFLSTTLVNTPGWTDHRTLAKFHIAYKNYFFMISKQISEHDAATDSTGTGGTDRTFYMTNYHFSSTKSTIPLTFGLKTKNNDTHIFTINFINSNYLFGLADSTLYKSTAFKLSFYFIHPGQSYDWYDGSNSNRQITEKIIPFIAYEDGYPNVKEADTENGINGDAIYYNPYYNTTTFSFASTTHGLPWANHKGNYQPINNILGFDILTGTSVAFATYKLPPSNFQFYSLKGPSHYHYFDEWGKEQESDTQTKRDLRSKLNQIEATLSASLEVKGLMRLGTAYPQIKELDGYDLGVGLKVAMGYLQTGLSRYDPYRRWVTPPTMLSVDLMKPDDYGKSYLSMTYTYARYEEFELDDTNDEDIPAGGVAAIVSPPAIGTTGTTLKHHINRQNTYVFGIGRTITI